MTVRVIHWNIRKSARAARQARARGPVAALLNEAGAQARPTLGYRCYGGRHCAILVRRNVRVLAHDVHRLSAPVPDEDSRSWGHQRDAITVTIRRRRRPVTLIAAHLTPPRDAHGAYANRLGAACLDAVIASYQARGHLVIVGADINRVLASSPSRSLAQRLAWHTDRIDWLGRSPGLAFVLIRHLGRHGSDHPGRLLRVKVPKR